jgi:hypothetical protein
MKKFFTFIALAVFMLISAQAFSLSILLINDNGYASGRVDVIKQAITDAGYEYTFYDAASEGSSPSLTLMQGFDLVIWYTGNDGAGLHFWNGDDSDNDAIKQYIDDGGMFWLQGLDFLYDRYKVTPLDFVDGDMMHDYFGVSQYFAQSHIDDGLYSDGVAELDVMPNNDIFTMTPVKFAYDYMWYVDALTATESAVPVYRLGPEGYDFYDYYSVIYNEKGDGKVLTCTFETARIDTTPNTTEFFKEGLDYFDQFGSGTIVYVTDINVHGENEVNTITENEGTLQMVADVLPENASNKAVLWSVTPGTAYATINGDGLLTAAGSGIGNGTVWVKATAADGSGVADSTEVTISNQGVEPGIYNILLVNDNANGVDRYLVLDTTLNDLGYTYEIYNTVVTGRAPDLITLSKYQLVIWYTGNDGANLNLWDVSDTNNYKFNESLIQYIDNGGDVWLQGLDFMYDVVTAPISFTAGQFIYDYMGIETYIGQSHKDDDGINLLQLDAVSGNGISTFTPIHWVYSDGLWYADAFDITPNATAMYNMGPNGYPFYGKACGLVNKSSAGYVMSWAFETARIDTRENTETIFDEVLTWFKNNTGVNENSAAENRIKVYPNPATNLVNINYTLDKTSDVQIQLFDITGKMISNLNLGTQANGNHSVQLSKSNLNISTGVYFYTLKINDTPSSGKVVFE